VNRIERGNQNISLEMIARIGEALDSEIVSLGYAGRCTCGWSADGGCPAP